MRLVVVGGSGASTPELFDAIVAWPGGASRRPRLDVVLHGRSRDKLVLVAAASEARLPDGADGVRVVTEVDPDAALEGADVVLVQARVGGLDARIFDETFPREFGLPGEETMGPGGFANALRTIPALTSIWDRIARRSPSALVLNLTNPSGIVVQAARIRTSLRIVSVCDSPTTFVADIAAATARTAQSVRARYVGMNHAGFWASDDPALRLAALPAAPGIDPADVERLGALPTSYLRFYLHPDRELASQEANPVPRGAGLKRLEADLLADYRGRSGVGPPARRGAQWYRLSVVPLLDAVTHGSEEAMVVGLPNRGRAPWASTDATVEGPAFVEAGGTFRTAPLAPLAGPAAALLERHADYEAKTASALAGAPERSPTRPELVAALAVNPLVGDAGRAAPLVDRILALSP